ncbi:SNF2-related protein [Ruminococcus flavefaciens]|uniref:SNF2-related protein n=1 Tax=Ruminococcus flavefaciens TaxID=1265 RepID=UPI00035D5C53|nr:SNF2-related protein [Ruminococcus flavefaciens]
MPENRTINQIGGGDMLKEKMYVRCAIDVDHPDEPRDFILGKIVSINSFSETAAIEFYDLIGIHEYYQIPEDIELSLARLQHCKIQNGAIVEYNGEKYHIADGYLNKDDMFYYYYIISDNYNVLKVCEKELSATFNASEISPLLQIKQYEFQNPMWYFGRSAVNKTIHTIDSAFYGFKELAGCKIFLKPYQLKTVMRCLSEENCRYMIADEVGLGKTIEASAVIKVFLSDKKRKRVLICVPDALVEQWKTELAFKFKLFDGENSNGNIIDIMPFSRILGVNEDYDFIVIDEVHSILRDDLIYSKILRLSRSSTNVIMLSATPVQSRNEEYHKLLSLIQPDKYHGMSEESFLSMLELQNKIVRKVHSAVEYLSDYKEAIEESENEHTEDTRDAFDELVETLEDIADRTNDKAIVDDVKKIDYESENFAILQLEKIVAYICEAYQLEKCVIRNRKKQDDTNIRELKELPYEMDCDFNNTEFRIYGLLSEWIETQDINKNNFDVEYLPIISSFFSSSAAFAARIKETSAIPDEIAKLTKKWIKEDKTSIKDIKSILDDPTDHMSRIVRICDYLEQEAYEKKVLIFTHFPETHNLYKELLITLLGESSCAFFSAGMSSDELELNTYRFQNNKECKVMLSDETGGEGRNFQIADELICLDLPWSANTLEQRIGRLDRIGREKSKNVVSVIVYSKDTVEGDLSVIWNKGLNIFNKSQSGLEIIMNDIDEQIKTAVIDDFKYGLSSIVEDMITEIQSLEKRVKEERHFDITAYQYQSMNKQIERVVEKYNSSESELFRNSMMSWSSLAGFKADKLSDDVVRFNSSSFSPRSAYNTLFVPPDMKAITEDKLNKMQNHVRVLNGDKELKQNPYFIQGTFDRQLALKSDYLHFFAPGDDIFDSIVDNAVNAYKGKCSAFALEGPINWEGFIFNWYMVPDELLLIENCISLKQINQYRGFISSDIISIYIPIDESDDEQLEIRKGIQKVYLIPVTKLKNLVANYGKRSPQQDFLNIKERYAISNLDWFKEKNPEVIWSEKVSACYNKSKERVKEEFKKKMRIKALCETLNKELSSDIASSEYFGRKVDITEKKRMNDIILSAFKKPKFILDSICYVRMIKNER